MNIKINTVLFLSIFSFFITPNNKLKAQKKECSLEDRSKEFMFVLSNDNIKAEEANKRKSIKKILIQGNPETEITVETKTIISKKYTIPESGFLVIKENFPIVHKGYSMNGVIHIKSSEDISVNVEREKKFNANNFSLVSTSLWGREYIIPSYPNEKSYKNFVDIIAKQNNTRVYVKDNKGKKIDSLLLQSKRVYEYESDKDITGYSITANKDIGIITGNHCLAISSACDHTATMLYDNSKLAKKYYTTGIGLLKESINRIVSPHNNNQITINGEYLKTINKGEFYEYIVKEPTIIETSMPSMAYFILDQNNDCNNCSSLDPSLGLIPSEDNAVSSAKFSISDQMKSKNIHIIVKTNEKEFLLFDGIPLDIEWKSFSSNKNISYGILGFNDDKTHSITTSKENIYFTPILLAYGIDASLGNAVGWGFNNLSTGEFFEEICKKSVNINSLEDIIKMEDEYIEVNVFDNDKEDGDVVSVYLNGGIVARNIKVKRIGEKVSLKLKKGMNKVSIKAENDGQFPPNTAGLTFDDGVTKQTIVIDNKKGKTKTLKIFVD